jgi:hypothetical protein
MLKKVLILILPLILTGCLTTGKGEKMGEVIKIAQEGIICKTWEGELIRGGLNDGSGGFGARIFPFTVENTDLLQKVQYALENNKKVKIIYHHEAITFCRSEQQKISGGQADYEGNNFLDDIQILS